MDRCRCGNKIVQPATGRRRTKCTDCSPPDKRQRGSRVVTLPTVDVVALSPAPVEGALTAATRVELEAAGREGTARGVAALAAAAAVDHGGMTAAGLAA